MPRRREVAKRKILPDPKFQDRLLAKFINDMMRKGEKSVAERVCYKAMDKVQYLDLAIDVHHIFPKKWCDANEIDVVDRESIVNKTPLAADTNRIVGGESRRFGSPIRIGFYVTAFLLFYIAVSGVACVEMESMLRYQFCAHALIVLALLQFLHQLPTPRPSVRALGMAATVLLSVAGFGLEGWYVWNFTRGGWVA